MAPRAPTMVECELCLGTGRRGLLGCPGFGCYTKPCGQCGGRGSIPSAALPVPPAGTSTPKGKGKGKGKASLRTASTTPFAPVRDVTPPPMSAAAKAKAGQARTPTPSKVRQAEMSRREPLQTARLFSAACEAGDSAACGRLLSEDVVSRQSVNSIVEGKKQVNVPGGPLYKLFRQAALIRDWEVMEDATYVLKELDEEWFQPPRGLGHCKGFDDFHQKSNPKALTAAVCSETGGLLIGTAWGLASERDAVDSARRSLQAVQRGELKAMAGSMSIMWPPTFQTGLLAATAGAKIVAQSLFVERRGRRVPLSRQLLIKDGLITRIMWWYTGPGAEITFRVPTPKLDLTQPLAIPEYWNNQKQGAFHETVSSSYITKVATGLLNGTFRHVSTRDRFGQPLPRSLKVVSAFRVEDAALWQRYDLKRREIHDHCSRWTKREPLKTDAQLPKRVIEGLDTRACEAYLFHGTSPDAAMGITNKGFCIDLAGAAVGTAFGKGAYFAECSSKSDEYAKAKEVSRIYETAQAMEQALSQAKGSVYALILCRVALGRMCRITEFDQQGHLRVLGDAAVHSAANCKFDSLLGDREAVVGTYREFIVYHAAQVYPEYVILYEREY